MLITSLLNYFGYITKSFFLLINKHLKKGATKYYIIIPSDDHVCSGIRNETLRFQMNKNCIHHFIFYKRSKINHKLGFSVIHSVKTVRKDHNRCKQPPVTDRTFRRTSTGSSLYWRQRGVTSTVISHKVASRVSRRDREVWRDMTFHHREVSHNDPATAWNDLGNSS